MVCDVCIGKGWGQPGALLAAGASDSGARRAQRPSPSHRPHPHPQPNPTPSPHPTDGKIAAYLEERVNVGVNFILSAEVDHVKKDYKFGFGGCGGLVVVGLEG